jgi:hypothetical protein
VPLLEKTVTSLSDYLESGGGRGLEVALGASPEAVIEEVVKSGLRGRGGGGFPTGEKWRSIRTTGTGTRFAVCNAAEGEPQVIRAEIQPSFREAARTANVRIAASSYASCMRAAGFRSATPRDAWEKASARFAHDGAKVSAAERSMAMSDARCQARSRIFEAVSRSLEESARAILQQRAGQLEMMSEIERSSVFRASAVVRTPREASSSP